MIIPSDFKTYFNDRNGHIDTLIPYFSRSNKSPFHRRERIDTSDEDFLDLDWLTKKSKQLVIISHGLEGSAHANYVTKLATHLHDEGFDILAWNCRGCSGEPNKTVGMYHSGMSNDLKEVIEYVLANYDYEELHLVGFSMGGNMTLKYLGEQQDLVPPQVQSAIAISPPIYLRDCAYQLAKGASRIYSIYLLRSLFKKIKLKLKTYPNFYGKINNVNKIKNFVEFDERVTAPLYGFKDAEDYWRQSSSYYKLEDIRTRTLIITAKNDPFLTGKCYPEDIAKEHNYLDLEITPGGGHVGFSSKEKKNWLESRVFGFINSLIK